ncbi:MAG: PfkB family carbohydrate kinase [Burkholderiaceae bacterium]
MVLNDTPAGAVLVVGAANLDITGSTRNPLTPGDSSPGRIRNTPGGVARNVAENLARLGTPVELLAAVGDDGFGSSLLASTGRAGAGVQGCWSLAGKSTSTYMSVHGPDGEMAIAINDLDIVEGVTPERLADRKGLLHQAPALMLDCNLPAIALQYLFENAAGKPVFVDAVSAFKCRRVLPWLSGIHTLKVNQLEAAALSGMVPASGATNACMADWLHEHGVRRVLLSLGERGVYWSERGGASGLQAAAPVPVVSVTGAGDALMAGLLHQTLRGAALRDAVRFSCACAAMTLLVPGANHAGLSDAAVRQFLVDGRLPD